MELKPTNHRYYCSDHNYYVNGYQKCVHDLGEAVDMIEKLSSDRDAWKLMAEAAMRDIRYGQSCDNCKYAGNSYGEDPCPDEEQLAEDSCQNWEWRGL